MGIVNKILRYGRDYGWRYTAKKVFYRYKIKYQIGKKYCPFQISDEEREKQEKRVFQKKICFSILVPLYNTPDHFLREMLDSVLSQTYAGWELCLADASDDAENGSFQRKKTIEEYQKKSSKIKYKKLMENKGISENTNQALALATGQYIALMDHDDLLHPSALYYMMETIENQKADFIYTDELSFVSEKNASEKTSISQTGCVQSIHLKPDFSVEDLRNNNYICHFTVFDRALLEKAGIFRKEFDGSQDYDLFLRLTEQAKKICHISKVLYFWRLHAASVASGVGAKPYVVEAGKKALEEHLQRVQCPFERVEPSVYGTFYKVTYALPENLSVKIYAEDEQTKAQLEKNLADCEFRVSFHAGNVNEEVFSEVENEDYVLFVRSGYPIEKIFSLWEEASCEKKDFWLRELISCLIPKQNGVAAGVSVSEQGKLIQAGYCYSEKLEGRIQPLFSGMPQKDPGYMNRLRFRQSVSLLGGAMLLLRIGTLKDLWEKQNELLTDSFSQRTWFAVCKEIRATKMECVVTPYVCAIGREEKELVDGEFCQNIGEIKDHCFNESMCIFGKYYFFWK